MNELLLNPDNWIAFLTLCALEIVLGIDNIIFISILTSKLPENQQKKARQLGLMLAMFMRLGLLFSISWIMSLKNSLFIVWNIEISGRDLILIVGGLFLIYKSVKEIHQRVEDAEGDITNTKSVTYASVITQIILVDLVFSLDSVITAVGMVDHIAIMIAAVVVSVGVMMASAASISNFVNRHPAIKILALAFLIMIGTALLAEGFDIHFPKGYIYFAMAFSVAVEVINIRIGSRVKAK